LEVADVPLPPENEDEKWGCPRCTFKNHPLINDCECCEYHRFAENDVAVPAVPSVVVQSPEYMKLPPSWTPLNPGTTWKRTPLAAYDPDYFAVVANVRKSFPAARISSIERVINPKLYRKYAVLKSSMEMEDGSTMPDESILFHGTSHSTIDIICGRGFNRSYCGKNATAWGKGVYFARDFLYSAHVTFSVPTKSGTKYVFQCRVLTGHYALGNPNLIEPPVRVKSTLQLYDSVVNDVAEPTIFVVFQDGTAYPEYLITFKV